MVAVRGGMGGSEDKALWGSEAGGWGKGATRWVGGLDIDGTRSALYACAGDRT